MIANQERYNEIKSFVDDFNRQLLEAEKRVMEVNTITEQNMNSANDNKENSETKQKKNKKNFVIPFN